MIACIGDVHGKYAEFVALVNSLPPGVPVIQLGDLGLFPDHLLSIPSSRNFDWTQLDREVLYVPGNHDHWPTFAGLTAPTLVRPNLRYVPRGTVLEVDGRRVGFLGGADSPDAATRVEGVSWFREEAITYADLLKFADVETVDLLATHTPPATVVWMMLGCDPDPSSRAVEQLWEGLGKPPLVCGHMHERRSIHRVEVLPELGLLFV